jgi:NTE family protein
MSDESISTSATRSAQDATDFGWDGHKLEPGIGIALSGGGFRAMLFHGGALARLKGLSGFLCEAVSIMRARSVL